MMTRAEIEQLKAQQERELAAFVEQANKEIAFVKAQIAALAMVLDRRPRPKNRPKRSNRRKP
jgi:DNA-binding protein H-NS